MTQQQDIAKNTGLSQQSVSRSERYIKNINERLPPNVQKVLRDTGRKVVVVESK